MAYRGRDLELRTPKGWSRVHARRPASGELNADAPEWLARAIDTADERAAPLWVDDVVLECCNQAYELAVVHRAYEVGLEHLMHAMTLVPASADVLDAAGVSINVLRRETGHVIASELPAATNGSAGHPTTSDEMDDLLRRAARRAYRDRSPITVEDLLQTLFDMKRDLPSRTLLTRNRSDWSLREPSDPAPRRHSETVRERARPPVEAEDGPPTVTDTAQNNRIDALERTVRELTLLLSSQAQSRAPLETPPDERRVRAGHDGADIRAHLDDLERNVDGKFRELARAWGVLGERLGTVEDLLLESEAPAGGISAELATTISDRLSHLDSLNGLDALKHIAGITGKLDRIEATFGALLNRVEGLETRLEARADVLAPAPADFSPVLDRLAAIERQIAQRPVTSSLDLTPMMVRFNDIERRLASNSQLDVGPIVDRLEAIETGLSASGVADPTLIMQRLAAMDTSLAATATDVESLTGQLDGALSTISAEIQRVAHDIKTGIDGAPGKVNAVFSQLSGALDTLRSEQAKKLDALSSGIGANNGEYHRDLAEVHEALLKLNANQQTLATSMDQWRIETTGDLGIIANRLDVLENGTPVDARQNDNIAHLSHRIDAIGTILEQREKRRSSFLMWMFGTEQWWSDGWRGERRKA